MSKKQDEPDGGISPDSKVLCRGICRDGTSCLNVGKYNGYCWRHKVASVGGASFEEERPS